MRAAVEEIQKHRRKSLLNPTEVVPFQYSPPVGGESVTTGTIRMYLSQPHFWSKTGQSWSQREIARSIGCHQSMISFAIQKLCHEGFLILKDSRFRVGKTSKTYIAGPNSVKVFNFLLEKTKSEGATMSTFSFNSKKDTEVKSDQLSLAEICRWPIQEFMDSIPLTEKIPAFAEAAVNAANRYIPRGNYHLKICAVEKNVDTIYGIKNRVICRIQDGIHINRRCVLFVSNCRSQKSKFFGLKNACHTPNASSLDELVGMYFFGYVQYSGNVGVVKSFLDGPTEYKTPKTFKVVDEDFPATPQDAQAKKIGVHSIPIEKIPIVDTALVPPQPQPVVIPSTTSVVQAPPTPQPKASVNVFHEESRRNLDQLLNQCRRPDVE